MTSSLTDGSGGDSRVQLSGTVKNSRSRKVPIVLLCILIVGSFLRFYGLGRILLYDDEPLHQVRISYQPFPFVVAHYNGSALFTFLIHALLRLGDIVLMSRLPSAVFGAITIIVVYILGKALYSEREGFIAAALAALSPFLIRHSQYSRAYALFVLLSLLSLYFFEMAQKENRTRAWVFYTVFTTLDTFTHLVAFLLLPAYALFMIFSATRKSRKVNPERPLQATRLKKFILWTSLICILSACFYMPSLSIKEFFAGSVQRALTQPSDVRVSFLLIHDILQAQWTPSSPFFYIVFLACLGIGIAAGLNRQRLSTGLSLLYMAVPYLIFILIKPRAANTLSADRYFIFILPVLLLFMARGITAFGTAVSAAVSRLGLKKAAGPGVRKAIQAALFLLIAGGIFSGFKSYYLERWRLGSLKIDRDVAAYLKKEVKTDALVYFDAWPVSSLNTLINPLSGDLQPEQSELMIRDGFASPAPENDFIVFSVGNLVFQEFVAGHTVDLWAIAELESKTADRLLAEVKNRPGTEAHILNGHVILHFQNIDEPAAQKTDTMARLFLSLSLDALKAQPYHLAAAKAALMIYGPEAAYRDLEAYKAIIPAPDQLRAISASSVLRLFDRLFGVSPSTLYRRVRSKDLAEIGRLLYIRGNICLRENDLDNALKAYQESLSLTEDLDSRISEKLASLATKMEALGRGQESLELFRQAAGLSPAREDLRFRLAEAYLKEGLSGLAEREYKKTFGLASLPPRFLKRVSEDPQTIIAWQEAGLWHVIFRAEEDTVFSGTMTTPKIAAVKKTGFEAVDRLKTSRHSLAFNISVKKGAVKALSFRMQKSHEPAFDIKINGRRETDRTIVLKK